MVSSRAHGRSQRQELKRSSTSKRKFDIETSHKPPHLSARALWGAGGNDGEGRDFPLSAGCSFIDKANCSGCCCRLSTTSFHNSRSCFTRSNCDSMCCCEICSNRRTL